MGKRVFVWFSHGVGRRKREGLGVSRGIGGCQAFFKKISTPPKSLTSNRFLTLISYGRIRGMSKKVQMQGIHKSEEWAYIGVRPDYEG